MNTRIPHRFASASSLLAALALTGGAAMADITVPGDVVVPAGGTLLISDNTTYSGTLTIEAGAQVVMGSNWQIRIASGATITVNGTEAEPVEFFRLNGEWNGLRMLDGSSGELTHVEFRGIHITGVQIDDASLVMDGCRVYDESTSSMSIAGSRYAVRLFTGAELTMDHSQIGPFYGKSGTNSGSTAGTGGIGYLAYGVYADSADAVTLTNNRFTLVQGGAGGKGGTGSTGTKGDNAPDAILFNGIQGDQGGTGGTGGTGGNGGDSYVVKVLGSDSTLIAQNIFDTPTGGRGGEGGKGGKGGTGGDGGDGAGGVVGNGGKGGKGGTGGTGGKGGTGGASGDVQTITISDPLSEPRIVNNTFAQITGRIGGAAGAKGDGGNGGAGGSGGGPGLGGSTGASGAIGDTGSTGTLGSPGADGEGRLFHGIGQSPSGFIARVNNNVSTFAGPGFTRAFESLNDGVLDADMNLAFGPNDLIDGPVIGMILTADPLFADGDYRLGAGSPAIDAGLNAAVPAGLVADYDGAARFQDDPAVVDTGLGDGEIVDLGAFEAPGEVVNPCPADTNGDGILDNGDIGAFISLFLAGDIAADFNNDGILDNGDIGAFVAAFLAGC